MRSDPVVVRADASLLDVHRVLADAELHDAPVIDDDGTIVGVISTLDLLRAVLEERDADELARMTAIDVANPDLARVEPNLPVEEVARLMRDQRVHRVLVVEDGALIGILSVFDLLRLVEDGDVENELELEHRVH